MTPDGLSPESRAWLRRHALSGALAAVRGTKPSPVPADPPEEILRQGGAFVTVRVGHELRGCIGTLTGEEGLIEAVGRLAAAAAVADDRFPPVRETDLPRLQLEISILSPLERIVDAADLEVGRHGVAVTWGGLQGVLLPHVALERGWSAAELVRAAASKAGIDPDALEDAKLWRFSAEVF